MKLVIIQIDGSVVMPILEILASSTAIKLFGFLMDKVVEYPKNMGTDKEIEGLLR